jgi:hypothetical protein
MDFSQWRNFKQHFLHAANYALPNEKARVRFSNRINELEEIYPRGLSYEVLARCAVEVLLKELEPGLAPDDFSDPPRTPITKGFE